MGRLDVSRFVPPRRRHAAASPSRPDILASSNVDNRSHDSANPMQNVHTRRARTRTDKLQHVAACSGTKAHTRADAGEQVLASTQDVNAKPAHSLATAHRGRYKILSIGHDSTVRLHSA